ncbi:MAG: HDOD domain-containing protein [Cyclobacteriaceae bacterium]|nr:HDOD domain-containing protein [Cyclobacteriaceae bacterium]
MDQQAEKYEKLANMVELVNDSEISSVRNTIIVVIKIMNDPKSTAKDLKDIIQVDPPLTARVLKLANSSYYSPPDKIAEIMKAIIWIGWDAIKELALSQKVCEIFHEDETIKGYSRTSLWKHSLAVAVFAKMIYRREFGRRGESIYAAGLLHDIGLILEDQFCHDEFKHALRKSKNEEKNLTRAEKEIFGYDHADLGNAITDSWKLPQELCVAIANHHNPDKVAHDFSRMTYTLHVADNLSQEKGFGYWDAPSGDNAVFKSSLRKLGIGYHALQLIVEDAEKEILKMEDQGLFN